MPSTTLGFVDYPTDGDTSWYTKAEDGLELWLERLELMGIPTYASFSDLPSPGTPASYDATGISQRQFAAVVDETAIYRVNDAQGSWELWVEYDVDTARLVDDAVTAAKIGSGAVGTTQLAADAVTASEIGSSAVGTTQLATGAVDADAIGTGAVNTDEIAASAVGTTELASNAAGFGEIDAADYVINNPNIQIPLVALDSGSPGDSYEVYFRVADGETATVYYAEALVRSGTSGGDSTNADLVADFIDGSDTTINSVSGARQEDATGWASKTNSTGGPVYYGVRIQNTGSSAFDTPGAYGNFGVVVE